MRASFLKYGVLISTAYAMVCMWHWKIGFTFFTQLSNIFAAGVVLAQLLTGSKKLIPVKFMAVVSVIVTALVFLTLVAPLMPDGIIGAYAQDHCASLCLHVITPLLTTADFLINERNYDWKRGHILLGIVPPVIYFVFILVLGAIGVRWFGNMTAPYPFLNYAAPAGWFGFRPDTIGPTSLGIGVGYMMPVILGLFVLLSWLLIRRRQ